MGLAVRSFADDSTGLQATPAAAGGAKPQAAWVVPAAVLKDQKIKPGPKLAWLYLWNLAGARAGTIIVSSAAVAADLGVSDRVARRWFDALCDAGLVEVVEASKSGARTVYVCDPRLVEQVRIAPGDPQGVLFEKHTAVLVPERVPKQVPRTVPKAVPKTPRKKYMNIEQEIRERRKNAMNAGSAKPQAAAFLVPKTPGQPDIDLDLKKVDLNPDLDIGTGRQIAGICNEVVNSVVSAKPQAAEAHVAAIAERIFATLGDAKLRRSVCRRVATAVDNGQIEFEDVQRAIDNAKDAVDAGKCEAAWIYFVGAMKRKFCERGVHWPTKPHKKPR